MSVVLRGVVVGLVALLLSPVNGQDWKTDVGFTKLLNEVPNLETGAGVDNMFVEAETTAGDYMPDVLHGNFSTKTLVFGSGPSAKSNHAHSVCTNFFGSTGSISPDVGENPANPVIGFTANDWLNFGLEFATGLDPNLQPYHVSNHSYIANLDPPNFTEAMAVNILQRLDFAINQSEMTTLVGTTNSTNGALPALLVQGYNSITVGVTDGSHAASETAPTYLYGNGRIKPEIVAPSGFTSFSTPMIGSAANLLHEAGAGTDAVRTETMKAILLAGATKDEFTSWSRTPSSPLDLRFGAGELNVCNSYYIQDGGQFNGTAGDPVKASGHNGWDYEPQIIAGSDKFYEVVVPENTLLDELSIVLTWNMEITDVNPGTAFAPIQSLADMNLFFFDSDNGFLNLLVDNSDSPVDNIEHIYRKNLMPGTYHFRVNSDMDMDYGIAWRGSTRSAPVIGGFGRKLLDGVVAGGQLEDALYSDDVYFELDPSPTANPVKQKIEMILLSETSVISPDFFGFRVEASMIGGPEGDVIQTIHLWDEANSVWEEVDSRPATNADTVVKIAATGDLTRFIHPQTSEIIAKVTWATPEFAGSTFTWSVDLDQAVWQITEAVE